MYKQLADGIEALRLLKTLTVEEETLTQTITRVIEDRKHLTCDSRETKCAHSSEERCSCGEELIIEHLKIGSIMVCPKCPCLCKDTKYVLNSICLTCQKYARLDVCRCIGDITTYENICNRCYKYFNPGAL